MAGEVAGTRSATTAAQAATTAAAQAAACPATTSWVAWGILCRLLVAAVFLYAAFGKLAEPERFAESVRAYKLVPTVTSNAVALYIPWVEVIAAGLLVVSVWRREARFVIFALLVVFTFVKVWAEVQGLKIDCGCFGGLSAGFTKVLNGPAGIVLNLLLMGLLVVDRMAQQRTSRSAAVRGA